MPSVYYCSQTNSTHFTTCCGCAITESEANCPGCGQEITPRSAMGRHEVAMRKLYGPKRLAEIRKAAAKRHA